MLILILLKLHSSIELMKFEQLSLDFKVKSDFFSDNTDIQSSSNKNNIIQNKTLHLDDELSEIWNQLIDKYFPTHSDLKNYKVVWSNKIQKRCLASCNIYKKIVRVAPSMKHYEARYFLEPLLYHELCHAIVGIKVINGRRKIHTREFKELESLHPKIYFLDEWIKNGGWNKVVRKDINALKKSQKIKSIKPNPVKIKTISVSSLKVRLLNLLADL